MSDMPPDIKPTKPAPKVPCPSCGQPSRFAPDNAWRPFCSERCKRLDLGAWASESYRVPSVSPPDDGGDGSQSPRDL